MVHIGQEQSMVYRESDMGPFEMSPQERQSCKYDIHKDIPVEKQKSVNLRKTEIIELLMETELGRGLGKQALLNMRLAMLFQLLSPKLLPPRYVKVGLAREKAYFKYYGREVS